jgi:hypothetical protein
MANRKRTEGAMADSMVDFATLTDEERVVVGKIIERAQAMWRGFGLRPPSKLNLTMDICAVHARMPLRLAEWLEADDFNFSHDIGGIVKHMNRQTGELEGFFVPRFCA